MQKVVHLQSLRAAAAILVLWAHAIDVIAAHRLPAWQLSFAGIENLGAVGVDIFFVISGFIVSISAGRSNSPWSFLLRRFLRVWPLYALATLLMFAISPNREANLSLLAWSLAFIQQPGIPSAMPTHCLGWSLFFEVTFYLMLALAMLCRRGKNPTLPILAIVVSALALGQASQYQQPLNIIGNPIILEFALGVLLGARWLGQPALPLWASRSLLAAGAILLAATAIVGYGEIENARHTLAAYASWQRLLLWGLPSTLLVAGAVFHPVAGVRASASSFLGDASYSIYLFGFPVLFLLQRHWPWFDAVPADILILAFTAMGTAAGILAYLLVERPLMRLVQDYPQRRSDVGVQLLYAYPISRR